MATVSVLNTDTGLSGKTLQNLEDNQTISGLKTFSRNPNPPFAVAAGSANVANLDADKLDGLDSTSFFRTDAVSSNSAQPRCSAWHNGTVSLTSGVVTVLALDTEEFDVGAMHDTVTNNSRITIPTGGDGLYHIIGQVSYTGNATGARAATIRKNGTTAIAESQIPSAGSATRAALILTECYAVLAATDYVELEAFQESGGALNSGDTAAGTANRLQVVKLW